jgi:hypothetical protein
LGVLPFGWFRWEPVVVVVLLNFFPFKCCCCIIALRVVV